VRTGTCVCCALRPEVDVGAASKGLTKSCNASHTIESDTNQVLNKGSPECLIRVVLRSTSPSMRCQSVWRCCQDKALISIQGLPWNTSTQSVQTGQQLPEVCSSPAAWMLCKEAQTFHELALLTVSAGCGVPS